MTSDPISSSPINLHQFGSLGCRFDLPLKESDFGTTGLNGYRILRHLEGFQKSPL